TVGGSSAAARNIISGNAVAGIRISDAGTDSNLVWFDFIGTDRTGKSAIPNGTGVLVEDGATNSTIANCVISGNADAGVRVSGANTRFTQVIYDWIGLDATGTHAVHQPGQGFSNYRGILFADGASANWAQFDAISGNYIGVALNSGATGDGL